MTQKVQKRIIFMSGLVILVSSLFFGYSYWHGQEKLVSSEYIETLELVEAVEAEPQSSGDEYEKYQLLAKRLKKDNWEANNNLLEAIDVVFVEDEAAAAKDLALQVEEDPGLKKDMYDLFVRSTPNTNVLFTYLEESFEKSLKSAERNHTTRGPAYAWGGSYLLETALIAYEKTHEERFLNLARDFMLEVLKNRDDFLGFKDSFRGRTLKSWGTNHLDEGGAFYNVVTHAGRIASMMAWYGWLVENNPTLQAEHGEAAEKLVRAAGAAILEFEDEYIESDDAKYGYYRRATDDVIEALNHHTSVALAVIYLAELMNDPFWNHKAEQMTEFVDQVMYEEAGGTIVWRYLPHPNNPKSGPPEPIWKAQVTIRFLARAERLGYGFSADDLRSAAETISKNVLRDGKNFNTNITITDYEPLANYDNHQRGGSRALIPLVVLSEYDSEFDERLVTIISENPDIGHWLSTSATSISYALRLPSSY